MSKLTYPQGTEGLPLEDFLRGIRGGGPIVQECLARLGDSGACLAKEQIRALRADIADQVENFGYVKGAEIEKSDVREVARPLTDQLINLARLECRDCLNATCGKRDLLWPLQKVRKTKA